MGYRLVLSASLALFLAQKQLMAVADRAVAGYAENTALTPTTPHSDNEHKYSRQIKSP